MNGRLNHYTVTIFGASYTVVSDESLESILKAASLVDSMMQDIAQKNPLLSAHVIAILVALQVSHEQQRIKSAHEETVSSCNALIAIADQCLQHCLNHQ